MQKLILKRLFFSISLIFVAATGRCEAQLISDSRIPTYPVVGLWNGFNAHLNVIECSNLTTQNISAEVILLDSDGSQITEFNFTVVAQDTLHLSLNQYNIAERYGMYEIHLLPGSQSLGNFLRCSTSIYRMASGATQRAVDYAYSLPILTPVSGTTYGMYNSYNAAGGTSPTYNWLSLYNPGNSSLSLLVERFDQSGNLLGTVADLTLGAGVRRDLALGHDSAENGGQVVGMYRIVPASSSQSYGAVLVRYGLNDGTPVFAFPLFASKGGCGEEVVFSSTMGPAYNWAEVANASGITQALFYEVRNSFGVLLDSGSLSVAPYQQEHIFLNALLGESNIGTLKIECANPTSGRILVESLFYGTGLGSQVKWAYGSQRRGLFAGPTEKLTVPVNTYLGMVNWFRALDSDLGDAPLTLESRVVGGSTVLSDSFSLAANTTIDIGPSLNFSADQVGSYALGSASSGVQIVGEILRVFYDTAGVSYIMPVLPAVFEDAVLQVSLQQVATGFETPVQITNAGDGSNRLFVVEQGGKIKIISNGTTLPTPFLDVSGLVTFGGEQGLLSVAFHPSFATNRKFYINYTRAADGDTIVAEYLASGADPNVADMGSARILLTVDQPAANHNGGQLQFGPDGYLYIGLGDGGGSGDTYQSGQDLSKLLGKILRVSVDGAQPYEVPADNPFVGQSGVQPEIWAWGFRNPWRFSFDREDGRLFVGDVGQNDWEEVDLVERGENYGWNTMEGTHCFSPSTGCDQTGLTLPISEYSHSEGISIVGGYLYRGADIPALVGKYVFADYSGSRIWVLEEQQDSSWTRSELLSPGILLTSFGEDEAGEIYVVGYDGAINKIVNSN